MSDLSFDELEAQYGELLPERETLGSIVMVNVGGAAAFGSHNTASNEQVNEININSGNTINSGNALGSYDGNFNHDFRL
jgi:hypothetical protein